METKLVVNKIFEEFNMKTKLLITEKQTSFEVTGYFSLNNTKNINLSIFKINFFFITLTEGSEDVFRVIIILATCEDLRPTVYVINCDYGISTRLALLN